MSNDSPASVEPNASDVQGTTRWKPLRIWPPVMLLAGMAFFRNLPQMIEDGGPAIWMSAAFGPALCGIL